MTLPAPLLTSDAPVTLVGGGGLRDKDLNACLTRGPQLVAADGGADAVLSRGMVPDFVIGDMDSLSAKGQEDLPESVLHYVQEQESTDFEKCLTRINAPLVLGVGFTGRRIDHSLAAFNVMARYPRRRCILINKAEIITLAPPQISLPVEHGCRVSLFPLGPVTGQSTGLKWPVEGIDFAANGAIGTSNHATGKVDLSVDRPAMLLFLPRGRLDILIEGLKTAPEWPDS